VTHNRQEPVNEYVLKTPPTFPVVLLHGTVGVVAEVFGSGFVSVNPNSADALPVALEN
jgi:hypothetical protein